MKRFVEALQKYSDSDIVAFFNGVNREMHYTVLPDEYCPAKADLKESEYSFHLNGCPLQVFPRALQGPSQFVLGLMILPGSPTDPAFVRNELTRVLGPQAGLDIWKRPVWFVAGGMLVARDDKNSADYYSSAYTGDHLDQVEDTRLPTLHNAPILSRLASSEWFRYPARDSAEWKGCVEQWFVGPKPTRPLYYAPDVTVYAPPGVVETSGLRLTLGAFGDGDPTPILQNLLTSWGISGADDLVSSAVAALAKSPRHGGTVVLSRENYVITLRTVQIIGTTYILELWKRTEFRPELRRYMQQIPRWKDADGKTADGEAAYTGDPAPDTPCHL
jgi:hypothetical protein